MPFQKGNKLGKGRPKGSRSKLSTLRESYVGAFKDIGGRKALTEWINESKRNKSQFFHDLLRLVPPKKEADEKPKVDEIIMSDKFLEQEQGGKKFPMSMLDLKKSIKAYKEASKLQIEVVRTVTTEGDDKNSPDKSMRGVVQGEVVEEKPTALPPARIPEDLSLAELEEEVKRLEQRKAELVKMKRKKVN